MNDKKNIDRLFQERFKDFEVPPSDAIWNNIHYALHKNKKRRIIPLWWKLSGIAAGFALAYLVFVPFSASFTNQTPVVNSPTDLEKTSNEQSISTETTVVANENGAAGATPAPSESVKNKINTRLQQKNNTEKSVSSLNSNSITNAAFAKNNQEPDKKTVNEHAIILQEAEESFIVTEQSKSTNPVKTAQKGLDEKTVAASAENNKIEQLSAINPFSEEKDSIALTLAIELKTLEDLAEKKNQKEQLAPSTKVNRWNVTTNVAPVFFNSASNGSPIASQFAENSKSYQNNLSVGAGIQYTVNKKWTFRTGINSLTLSYGTNDVVFFGALESAGFSNLSASTSDVAIAVFSVNNSEGLRPYQENLENMERGSLNQRMGYYEVPLELSYAVVNRKLGVHVIGGLSTLFLNANAVSVQSAATTMSLGKANNLNDIHFSSNIGLGFKYEFWKNFEAHFEPTFKYQFNTFSRDAGNFRPYFVGLYSGVSFRF
jgi:hypothetical protein